jgi:hypothetical protein
MSTDFAPVFEKKFHDKVVPGLLHLMDDYANPRVQAHAGNECIPIEVEATRRLMTSFVI